MIAHIDKRFGDLEKFLDEQKLKDNTIVIFMTDNGGTAGVPTFNAGLRGGKTTYYDGGHRVPCWVRWPDGKLGEPRDIDDADAEHRPASRRCASCAASRQPKRDATDELYRGDEPRRAAARRRRRSCPTASSSCSTGRSRRSSTRASIWGKWRLVKGEELYDVEADRAQKTNVADKHPDVVKAMRDHYEEWWKGVEPIARRLRADQPRGEAAAGGGADERRLGGHLRRQQRATSARRSAGRPAGTGTSRSRRPASTSSRCGAGRSRRRRRWATSTSRRAKSPAEQGEARRRSASRRSRRRSSRSPGVKAEAKADPKATGATLTVKLPAGKTKLKAWFADADGKDLCGAFFVTVRKK